MFRLESYLYKVIKYGLYAILLTPLVFWPRALFGFMTPKFILFQVLVEIVFAAWLALLLLNNANVGENMRMTRITNNRLAISGISKNPILLVLLGFIAISFISAFFGVDFSRSFWGIGARMTGLFAELHFFAWFLVLATSLNNANNTDKYANDANRELEKKSRLAISGISNKLLNWHYYLNFSFAISILVALSAFYENTAWRLVYGSTFFNNPTFVGPYFLFHFFWGLYETIFNFQFSISKVKRWFFGAGTALLALVIFLGEIRGAILGLFIGLIVFGLGLIFTDMVRRRFKILLLAFFIAILIGLSGLWFARESAFVQNTSALKRLTQISIEQTTIQTRLIVWRLAVAGFKERILFGAGPENFNYVFNAHYNSVLLKYGLGETWFDKPHNAFLEILTEIGAIGGLAYLLILISVVFSLFKEFKNGQKILILTLASAFTAYLSSIFFSFDSFGSWFGLYLMLGFLASHNNANKAEELRMPRIANNLYSQLAVLAITLVTFALLYVNYGIWRANIADADALRIFPRDSEQGTILFKKSLTYFSPYKSEYQFDLLASVSGAIAKNLPISQLEDNLNFALNEADKAIKNHPQNAAYYTDMVKLYNILGEKGGNSEILNQAEIFGKKSLELSPRRQETRFYLARTALLKGDSKLAVQWTKEAEELNSTVNLSHWYLGLALIADNRREIGIIEIKKALELGYQTQNKNETDFIKNLGL